MSPLEITGPKHPGRYSRWIALSLCLCVAVLSAYQAYQIRFSPSDLEIANAEDEVYEAVIRDMLPKPEHARGMLLVFDDQLIVGDFPGGDVGSCEAASTKWVQATDEPPPFDTSADRVYRLLTGGVYRTTPRPEVVESFLRRRCIGGRLSRSFRTDIAKSFVVNDDFLSGPLFGSIAGDLKFARLFPGATGIIGLSHVGFDKQIGEAIVTTSYICGGLCGGGHRYFLKKVGGRWIVVSKRGTWVS